MGVIKREMNSTVFWGKESAKFAKGFPIDSRKSERERERERDIQTDRMMMIMLIIHTFFCLNG
jgi:hypothetical protein